MQSSLSISARGFLGRLGIILGLALGGRKELVESSVEIERRRQ
jgi:hypothetical protein